MVERESTSCLERPQMVHYAEAECMRAKRERERANFGSLKIFHSLVEPQFRFERELVKIAKSQRVFFCFLVFFGLFPYNPILDNFRVKFEAICERSSVI